MVEVFLEYLVLLYFHGVVSLLHCWCKLLDEFTFQAIVPQSQNTTELSHESEVFLLSTIMKALQVTSDPFLKDYNSFIRLRSLLGMKDFQMYFRLLYWLNNFSLKDHLRFFIKMRRISELLKWRVILQELLFLSKVVLLELVKGWGGFFVLILIVVEVLVFSFMERVLLFFCDHSVTIFNVLKVSSERILT